MEEQKQKAIKLTIDFNSISVEQKLLRRKCSSCINIVVEKWFILYKRKDREKTGWVGGRKIKWDKSDRETQKTKEKRKKGRKERNEDVERERETLKCFMQVMTGNRHFHFYSVSTKIICHLLQQNQFFTTTDQHSGEVSTHINSNNVTECQVIYSDYQWA